MPEHPLPKTGGLEKLYPEVYEQLKQLAHRQLLSERSNHTLNTTGLVHEAYLKMAAQRKQDFINRPQFFALAAQSMRRILIDYARRQQAKKGGGGKLLVTLEEAEAVETTAGDLLALHEAIGHYQKLSQRGAQIIELWFFGGFRQEEVAELLGISPATVRREWALARAWLSREVKRIQQ